MEKMTPPWEVYKDEPPYSGIFRQGNGEVYLSYIWLPFWESMTQDEKTAYLNEWHAPEEWREHLRELAEGYNDD